MLRYTEFGISHSEVPGESNLCIYISGCCNKCNNCHYPELQSTDYGEILSDYFMDIIDLYRPLATCVCFMGEGDLSKRSKEELLHYAKLIKDMGLKVCLYSGRDFGVEEWMYAFDYIKTGSYKEELGALDKRSTNQRLYHVVNNTVEDITELFWK